MNTISTLTHDVVAKRVRESEITIMKVAQIMTQAVRICHFHDSLKRAAHIMWDFDLGCLPVVDLESKLIGVITDRDICMAAYTQGRALHDLRVEGAMAIQPQSVRDNDSVASVERKMREHQVHRVPVIDADAHVVGMLSINDVVREAVRERESGGEDILSSDVLSTLAAIRRPRTEALRHGSDGVMVSQEKRSSATKRHSSAPAGAQRASQPSTGRKRHGSTI